MRKSNPLADTVTKHVLQYLLNKFHLQPGDINNIRMIITRSLNKNTKIKPIQEIKKKKAP